MMQQKQNYTLPIIVMFFLFAMISFVTGFQNPFGIILKQQLGLANWQSQLGNAANFIAYAFMGLPAGMILQKKGYKFTSISAVLVGFIGVALMFASSYVEDPNTIFAIYMTGAFVGGFSMCMLNTVVNPMLNTLAGGGNKGNQLIQIGGSLNSLAATICPVLVGYLMGQVTQETSLIDGRPALMIAMGIFALAYVVLLVSKLPEPILDALKNGEKKEEPALKGLFQFPHYVMGVIAIFLYVGIEVGIPNMANLYMTSTADKGGLGMDATIAGSIVGAYWFLMMIGRLVGGAIGGKVSAKAMLSAVSTAALAFIVLGIMMPSSTVEIMSYTIPLNVLFFVLCGLCTSVMWGGIFNLAAEGLGKYTALASGFFMVMVCGGGLLPLLQGAVADFAGYLNSYWVLFAALCYMLFYALVGSKVTKRAED
ncbi:MAG: MFS transporter [Bacteroidaceae bacterium]|nr:MFS transporter [Bacteroidaceae bacterium]MBQ2293470.1 MFS transporter [Bacteroidaceae bacterium]MBQ5713252.1 MFS transporter [Bacteroidaceae bacterium]